MIGSVEYGKFSKSERLIDQIAVDEMITARCDGLHKKSPMLVTGMPAFTVVG
jgi:hypothetical protein